MSYLSLISWTERDVLCVATRIRSAYSSVSNRETSFSRIARDSVLDIHPSIYPVLGFDTRRSGGAERIYALSRCPPSHDWAELRLRNSRGPVPGKVEQTRVRLLSIHDDGTIHAFDMEHDVRDVLQLGGRRGAGCDEAYERVLRAADRGEDAGHALDDLLPVHGLEGVEGQEGEERSIRLRQLVLHVRPFQIRLHVRRLHVKDDPGDLGRTEGRFREHADVPVERGWRKVRTHEFPKELGAAFPRRNVGHTSTHRNEIADHRGSQPVHVIRGHGIGNLECDHAAPAEAAGDPVQRLDSHAHDVLRGILHRLPDLGLRGPDLLADVERGEASAVQGIQVPMLLHLLPAQLFNRQDPEPPALVLRGDEADHPVPEIVEPGLAAAFQDVHDILLAALNEVLLEDRDESGRRNPIVLAQGIDRIDEDEGPLRETFVDELVRGL